MGIYTFTYQGGAKYRKDVRKDNEDYPSKQSAFILPKEEQEFLMPSLCLRRIRT